MYREVKMIEEWDNNSSMSLSIYSMYFLSMFWTLEQTLVRVTFLNVSHKYIH